MNWKKLAKQMFFLPVWVLVALTVVSTTALIIVFIKKMETSPAAFVVYTVSFYTFTVLCIDSVKTFPAIYKTVKGKLYGNRFTGQYLTNVSFKTHVNLYRSLSVNLIYIILNGVSAIVFSTHWFAIFAVYYAVMAVMRFLLAAYIRKNSIGANPLGELKIARICACILVTIIITLSAAVLMMIFFRRGFEYKGIFIYVMALYTFYAVITAVIDVIKYRKYKSPVISASNVVKLASALVSLLFLETAMLSQFGAEMTDAAKNIMIIATGTGISVIIITISVYMIISTTKEIKAIKGEKYNG